MISSKQKKGNFRETKKCEISQQNRKFSQIFFAQKLKTKFRKK